MKAENILNSNLASKIQFVMKKFAKNEFFKILVSFLTAFFSLKREFFKMEPCKLNTDTAKI